VAATLRTRGFRLALGLAAAESEDGFAEPGRIGAVTAFGLRHTLEHLIKVLAAACVSHLFAPAARSGTAHVETSFVRIRLQQKFTPGGILQTYWQHLHFANLDIGEIRFRPL
jgi:hypothetical protein